jgi:inner membrane protein
MPSPLGHAIAGITAGWLVAGAPTHPSKVAGTFPGTRPATFWRESALFGALAALPDVDLLFGMHSGPTHSLAVAGIVGLATYLLARPPRGLRRGRFAIACAAAYASHVLLDWLARDTTAPIGIMALWPFSYAHYESDLHIFRAISRRYYEGWTFVDQNVRAVSLELVILIPLLVLIIALRRRRAATATAAVTALALLASVTVTSAEPRGQRRPMPFEEDVRAYDRLLDRYRSGAVEEATGDLRKLLIASSGQRQIARWIAGARAANRRADLQTVPLLITEPMMAIWATDEPFPFGRLAPYMGRPSSAFTSS